VLDEVKTHHQITSRVSPPSFLPPSFFFDPPSGHVCRGRGDFARQRLRGSPTRPPFLPRRAMAAKKERSKDFCLGFFLFLVKFTSFFSPRPWPVAGPKPGKAWRDLDPLTLLFLKTLLPSLRGTRRSFGAKRRAQDQRDFFKTLPSPILPFFFFLSFPQS